MNKKEFIEYCSEVKAKVEETIKKIKGNDFLDDQCAPLGICLNTLNVILDDVSNSSDVPDKFFDMVHHKIQDCNFSSLRPEFLPDAWKIKDEEGHISYTTDNIKDVIKNTTRLKFYYNLLRTIGINNHNIVIVGANGSGKTTLASYLKKTS